MSAGRGTYPRVYARTRTRDTSLKRRAHSEGTRVCNASTALTKRVCVCVCCWDACAHVHCVKRVRRGGWTRVGYTHNNATAHQPTKTKKNNHTPMCLNSSGEAQPSDILPFRYGYLSALSNRAPERRPTSGSGACVRNEHAYHHPGRNAGN